MHRPLRMKSRKLWARLLAILAALLVAAVAGVALAFPSLASTFCPGCYGLTELEESVYTEDGLSGAQQAQVRQTVQQARRLVADFYGTRRSSPTVLACLTESCYKRIGGGGERGIAVLNRSVLLSPKGIDPVIAAHEMSHVELHTCLTSGAEVPQWFDEGLAVVVADDPRYLAPKPASETALKTAPETALQTAPQTTSDRCLVSPSAPLPQTLDEWLNAASKDVMTYAKSACQVSRWLAANNGRTGLLTLIDDLNAGHPFPLSANPARLG
ncbi:hypothetical protein AB0C28_09980 [Nonomuraea sp. NPDC048892]|uniref:hypothetical protein n=1 Tax=Nonomuraea sp. NPDC048892 TaxID=3154624 RepID=UPI0033E898D5